MKLSKVLCNKKESGMDQNPKVAQVHKKYHVRPKAVVDIFCKPVVPFSTGVTLTKRPSNSYECPVAHILKDTEGQRTTELSSRRPTKTLCRSQSEDV